MYPNQSCPDIIIEPIDGARDTQESPVPPIDPDIMIIPNDRALILEPACSRTPLSNVDVGCLQSSVITLFYFEPPKTVIEHSNSKRSLKRLRQHRKNNTLLTNILITHHEKMLQASVDNSDIPALMDIQATRPAHFRKVWAKKSRKNYLYPWSVPV